jgi:hypothetical protein
LYQDSIVASNKRHSYLCKKIKELCIKKTGRKKKDPQTVHVVGQLADLMSGKIYMKKYVDPGSPIVKIHINNIAIANTLIDLGATINVMTKDTMNKLQLSNLRNTPTILQLADRSTIKPEGILEDIIVSLDSWEYPIDFMVLQPKSNLGGHPLILGRPWLATIDAFISCRSGDMTIAYGDSVKKFNLYPPTKALTESEFSQCFQETNDNEEIVQPILTIDQIMNFKNDIEENQIINLINNYDFSQYHGGKDFDHQYILDREFQESCTMETLSKIYGLMSSNEASTSRSNNEASTSGSNNEAIENFQGKTLNINLNLEENQKKQLIKILQTHSDAFAWEYTDMRGIHPNTCIHHIYIEDNSRPVRNPKDE